MFPLDKARMESGSGIPRTEDLFDLGQTDHTSLFGTLDQVWEVIPRISDYLLANLRPGQLGQAHGQGGDLPETTLPPASIQSIYYYDKYFIILEIFNSFFLATG